MNEFDDLIQRLRDERPELSSLELDQVKQRVRMRARDQRKGSPSMKSRLAILATLVTGLVFSMTGATLAVSGLTTGNDASVAQYGTPTPTPTPGTTPTPTPTPSPGGGTSPDNGGPPAPPKPDRGDVLGDHGSNSGNDTTNTAPSTSTPAPEPQAAAQPTRQVEVGASGSELPFTGFAAIPVLLIGVALLATGLILRRRQTSD